MSANICQCGAVKTHSRGAIREILEWLKADHAATLTTIDNLE